MSSLTASLTKQVGPMPLGAWLLVGAGGLFIAYRSHGAPDAPDVPAGDPLPVGGGYGGGGASAIDSWDGAAVVLSPVFQLPSPTVNVNVATPVPSKTPAPKSWMPVPTPRVASPVTGPSYHKAPTPAPKPAAAPAKAAPATSYTVKAGDTLWGIAGKVLGNPLRWPGIYAQNTATIEAAAKAHGHASSSGGRWIFPGTVLRVTR